jgi:enediyne biosynthesis protein E4
MPTSTASVRAGDFNGDGKLDLFVGGRLTPRNYPAPTRSYVLRNDGDRFTDVTREIAPELALDLGMITDAQWLDFDGDKKLDLVTAGEWMPVQFYRNEGTRLRDVTASMRLPPLRGWWYSLAVGDVDADGRPDVIAGNLGLNAAYRASAESKLGIYASPFTGGQNTDVLLTQQVGAKEFPIASLASLSQEMYSLGVKFPTYGSFAPAAMDQLFSAAELQQAMHYQADSFASVVLHNDGAGAFSVTPLPSLAQASPIRSIVPHDVDGDGHLDLIVAGNLFDVEPNTPRVDAGNGLWLRGDGKGQFGAVSPRESGFLAPHSGSGLAVARTPTGTVLLVANTGDALQLFSIGKR